MRQLPRKLDREFWTRTHKRVCERLSTVRAAVPELVTHAKTRVSDRLSSARAGLPDKTAQAKAVVRRGIRVIQTTPVRGTLSRANKIVGSRLNALYRTRLASVSRLSLVLILIGVVLLGYVAVEYYTMYSSQRQLAREWEAQQKHAAEQASAGEVTPVNDGLTRLSIPKINLSAVIVDGTSRRQLLLGPGRVKDSAVPGEEGNSVVTAHRDTFFRHIYELNKGDVLTVERNGKIYNYKVVGKRIVDPSDVSVLRQTKDARLTLITCYPTYYIGPAPERLVVVSKRVDEGEQQAKADGAQQ